MLRLGRAVLTGALIVAVRLCLAAAILATAAAIAVASLIPEDQ